MRGWIHSALLAVIRGPIIDLLVSSRAKNSESRRVPPGEMEMDVIDISSSDSSENPRGVPAESQHAGISNGGDRDLVLNQEDDDVDVDDLFEDDSGSGGSEVEQPPQPPDSQRRILPSYMNRGYGTMADSGPQPLPAPLGSSSQMVWRGSAGVIRDINVGGLDYHHQSQEQFKPPSLSRRALPPSLQQRRKSRQLHEVPLKLRGDLCIGGYSDSSSDDELYMYEDTSSRKPMGKFAANSHPAGKFGAGSSQSVAGTALEGEATSQNYNVPPNHRVLPHWMNGRSDLSSRYAAHSQLVAGISDGREQHMAFGDQGPMDHDERLIYETVLQDLAQPKSELDLDDGLMTVALLRHQKIALAWMEQKERTSRPCSGGILADDQGLGKTISMIALILKQMTLQRKFMSSQSVDIRPETFNLDEEENSKSADRKPGILKLDTDNNTISQVEKKDYAEDQPKLATVASMSSASKGRPAAGTLVVCPSSILRQWARELNEKVASDVKLSVKIYHGSSRTKRPSELAKYDVVITSYTIITNEVPKQSLVGDDDSDRRNPEDYGLTPDFSNDRKRKPYSCVDNKKKKKKGKGVDLEHGAGPLSKVRWFRIILDEAQVIKNHRTQVARACCGLRAKTRWCLSGTPLQNAVEDLYSYFRFLKYDPYAKYSSFGSALKYPLLRDPVTGYKKLQAVLRAVMLRRTKDTTFDGQPILKLPPKSVSLKKLCFSVEERSFYAGLEANFRDRFKVYAAEGTVKQNYANILIMLLRLRQACDHPVLVKDYGSDSSGKTSIDVAKHLPKDTIRHLLSRLDASSAICVICNDPPEDAVVTICGHVFCYQCISESVTGEGNLCPAAGCHFMLYPDSLFSRGTLRCCIPDELDIGMVPKLDLVESTIWSEGYISTKIRAALKVLIALQSRNSIQFTDGMDEDVTCSTSGSISDASSRGNSTKRSQSELPQKAIVFSQWTSMLDLLESSLNLSLIPYRRLDGSMSLASRDRAVKDFNMDPEVTVMIMSLKSGNLGLNMVAACHVILLDLWWNPTSEDQAVDRAHRIGQTRPVSVHRLTIEDTVEERILQLQEKKREMVSSAFGEDASDKKTATRLTMEDLRYLFQV